MSSKQKLDSKAIGIATGTIVFILSILCLLAILLFGDSTIGFFNLFFHGIGLSLIRTTTNIAEGIIGSIALGAIGFIFGWLFAVIYNKYSD